jgi:hypothetical protein
MKQLHHGMAEYLSAVHGAKVNNSLQVGPGGQLFRAVCVREQPKDCPIFHVLCLLLLRWGRSLDKTGD